MTDLNEKALEAARRAIEAHPAYDCGSTGDEEMARAAIRAYLTALAEDDAAVERVAEAIYDESGGEVSWRYDLARAAIRAMGADHD